MNRADDQERIQRIRRGLTGLAVVFLFVLLASAISRSGDPPSSPKLDSSAEPAEPNEPLAQIGAAPGTPTAENETVATEPSPAQPSQ